MLGTGLVKTCPRVTDRTYRPVTRAGFHGPKCGTQEAQRTMYGCEVLWDAEKAQRVQELMEQGTGRPCPCKTGKRCPILPKTLAIVPTLTNCRL